MVVSVHNKSKFLSIEPATLHNIHNNIIISAKVPIQYALDLKCLDSDMVNYNALIVIRSAEQTKIIKFHWNSVTLISTHIIRHALQD